MKKIISLLTVILVITSACTTTEIINERFMPKMSDVTEDVGQESPAPEIIINPLPIEPILNEPLSIEFDPSVMPVPFSSLDTGGNMAMMRFTLLGTGSASFSKLDAIPMYIREAFVESDDYRVWSNSPEMIWNWVKPATSLMDYKNLFSLVITFNIPADELSEVMREVQQMFMEREAEDGRDRSSSYFTDEEIEIFTSLDEARILEYFISDYSIFCDGRGFTPAWIYYHTPDDYEAVGITPEMIGEQLELFSEFDFLPEATIAFEEKLSEFMGIDVSFRQIRNQNNQGNDDNDQGNQNQQ